MSTQFRPIEIPPGVVATATKNMRSSNWAEVNLMRWVEGRMTPVGGQAQYKYNFASRCRAIHSWYDLNGVLYIAYLCESNLYVDVGGALTEITPVGGMNVPVIGAGGYGEGAYSDGTYNYGESPPLSTIQLLDQLPDAYSLDNFGQVLLAMTSADGRLLQWTPSAGYPGANVTTVLSAAFDTTTDAISVSPNPGIMPGMSVWNETTGHQVGVVETYAAGAITLTANAMSASSGAADTLYFSSTAAVVAGAPLGRLFVVTPQRFVMIFGTAQDGTLSGGGFNRFAWCDQENPYSWDFSNVTSQAGYLDVEPASPIVAAMATKTGVLFWTGTTCYQSAFLGIPYIYNYSEIAKNCTPWSPQSRVVTASLALWMSKQGMFSFDGTSVASVVCPVRPWVDDDVDLLNVRWQACLVHVADFNEVWFFFPQNGQPYNTRCIIYSYKEGWWSQGTMSRSAGISAAYTVHTIMADDLNAYEHEAGNFYPANVPLPWAETFDLNLATGSRLITVKQMIPDVKGDFGNLYFQLAYSMNRSVVADDAHNEKWTDPIPARSDGYVDFRTTGRDVRLAIGINGPQVNPVTVGQCLIDAAPRGDR